MPDILFVKRFTKEFIVDLLDKDCSPQDIIEGIEEELDRFEELVFDYPTNE